MSEYGKSCDNCNDPWSMYCGKWRAIGLTNITNIKYCKEWKPIPCPHCGGWLSDVREHEGKRYRHCYACHSELFEEVTACDTTGI